jgi:hypothetical protein
MVRQRERHLVRVRDAERVRLAVQTAVSHQRGLGAKETIAAVAAAAGPEVALTKVGHKL